MGSSGCAFAAWKLVGSEKCRFFGPKLPPASLCRCVAAGCAYAPARLVVREVDAAEGPNVDEVGGVSCGYLDRYSDGREEAVVGCGMRLKIDSSAGGPARRDIARMAVAVRRRRYGAARCRRSSLNRRESSRHLLYALRA
jgi:hypothetical protein